VDDFPEKNRSRDSMSQTASSPFFSVVMPVYNGESFLSQAIESVIAQTARDWEMIVVDDASLDGTPGILAGYTSKYSNIRVFRNEENIGIAKTLNRGIREARGEWIVHLDSDDLFIPEYLETLQSFIARLRHPYCFISSWVTVIDGKGEKVIDVSLPSAKKIARMMNFENFLYHPATSFPKSVWERVGGYPDEDRKLSEDTEMWKRFFRFGVVLIMIPRHLVYYRIHDANYTSFKDSRCAKNEDRNRALAQQYHEWRISLFLKQGELRAARYEIFLLRKTQQAFSLKNICYYLMTILPKSLVYKFMWEVRPRFRRLARALMMGLSRNRHYSS
jgi:glycosyltransferase involved in cell wall biosynthesis